MREYGFTIFLSILTIAPVHAHASETPWGPSSKCTIVKRSQEGLIPNALLALKRIGADHRITQTINFSNTPSNYHGVDISINGKSYTAAVDISVRCLDSASIKTLLSTLASEGFAAWYREDGKDSWKGVSHIHAVWAEEPLKSQLRTQVNSWLGGKTGLVKNAPYTYWQPSAKEKAFISEKYEASKTQMTQ